MNETKITKKYYPNGQIMLEDHQINWNSKYLVKEWWPNGNLRINLFRIGIRCYGIHQFYLQSGIRGTIKCFNDSVINGPKIDFIYYEINDIEM